MPLLLKSMWANHNHSVPLSNVHPTISSWWRWIYIYFTRSIVLILLLMVTTTGGSSGSKEWKRGPLYCIIMTPSSPKRKVLHINDSMMWNSVKRFYFLPTKEREIFIFKGLFSDCAGAREMGIQPASIGTRGSTIAFI